MGEYIINNVPDDVSDQNKKIGFWIDQKCSCCNTYGLCDGWGQDVESAYCPHCGARLASINSANIVDPDPYVNIASITGPRYDVTFDWNEGTVTYTRNDKSGQFSIDDADPIMCILRDKLHDDENYD